MNGAPTIEQYNGQPVNRDPNPASTELPTSAETNGAIEKDATLAPPVVSSTAIADGVKADGGKEGEISIKPVEFSIGFPYFAEPGVEDIRVTANSEKLNNKELPLAV